PCSSADRAGERKPSCQAASRLVQSSGFAPLGASRAQPFMTLAFVLPPCPNSPLSRLDPRWRLAALALAGLAVTLLQSLPASLALVALATAPLEVNLKAAHALHMPGLLIHLTLLAFRYLFVLGDELGRLRIAVRVRGYRNRMSRHCYRTIGHLAGTLLVRGDE